MIKRVATLLDARPRLARTSKKGMVPARFGAGPIADACTVSLWQLLSLANDDILPSFPLLAVATLSLGQEPARRSILAVATASRKCGTYTIPMGLEKAAYFEST